MRFGSGIILGLVGLVVSCSDPILETSDVADPLVEKPVTVLNLVGKWTDFRHSEYEGGGNIEVSREFSFSADSGITYSQITNDSPPSGATSTYIEFTGTFTISDGLITCYATKYRTSQLPFTSAGEGWTIPTESLAILACPAMIIGNQLYWNPISPVWTEKTSNDPNSVLSVEATILDVLQEEKKLTWNFHDSGGSLYSIWEKDQDGAWQQTSTISMANKIADGKLVELEAGPDDPGTAILRSGSRYIFGSTGVSTRD